MSCNGVCHRYKAEKPNGVSRYQSILGAHRFHLLLIFVRYFLLQQGQNIFCVVMYIVQTLQYFCPEANPLTGSAFCLEQTPLQEQLNSSLLNYRHCSTFRHY